MIDSNQVYIRFRGRTVGPIVKAKALDMAKRGQLTRSHEISFDGSTWSLAGDMDEFFPAPVNASTKAQSAQATLDALEASPNEQWYAHYDGDNQGPMDLLRMMALIDSGRVRGETMVWKSGTPSWVEARVAFPGRFQGTAKESGDSGQSISSDGKMDLERLAALIKEPKDWIMFHAVVGIVFSCFMIPLATLGFVAQVSSRGGGPGKALVAIWFLVHIFMFAAIFYASGYLLRLSNAIGVLKYRLTVSDVEATFLAANRFWKLIGTTLAFAIVFEIVILFSLSALGVSLSSGLIPSF